MSDDEIAILGTITSRVFIRDNNAANALTYFNSSATTTREFITLETNMVTPFDGFRAHHGSEFQATGTQGFASRRGKHGGVVVSFTNSPAQM